MAKVITFSRTFPAYHPKKGQPTFFVEKFLRSWDQFHSFQQILEAKMLSNEIIDIEQWRICKPKHHTIRAGKRFKVGEYFSPRIWSGKPYNSKQIVIAPDTQIKKIWDFEIIAIEKPLYGEYRYFEIKINDKLFVNMNELSTNDGLSENDLWYWFTLSPEFKKKSKFSGQIICWNTEIKY